MTAIVETQTSKEFDVTAAGLRDRHPPHGSWLIRLNANPRLFGGGSTVRLGLFGLECLKGVNS
jgi:hypothetical protein